MLPASASCSVAMVRIRVDLPAPLGPSRPNRPVGMASETSCRAATPLGYVFDKFLISSMSRHPCFTSRYEELEISFVVGPGTKNTARAGKLHVGRITCPSGHLAAD